MSTVFYWRQLRGAQRSWQPLLEQLQATDAKVEPWGVWAGLFGVPSTDLFVMSAAEPKWRDATPAGVEVVAEDVFLATARPTTSVPLQRPGLHVFRYFEVDTKNIDEIVDLSVEAWTFFENSADYSAEPQGLFRCANVDSGASRMLLVTWYDSMASWATSRQPAPEATANFRRRQALTRGTVAYAMQRLPLS